MAPYTSSLQSWAITSPSPHWPEKHMVRNISSVLCSYFMVVLCLPGLLWMLHDFAVFSWAEPENPDESCHLHLSFKSASQHTSHDITKMQRRGQGCSEVTQSYKDEPLLPVFPVMLLWVTRYFHIIFIYVCIYIYLPRWHYQAVQSQWLVIS